MTADMINFPRILTLSTRSVFIRFINDNFYTRAMTFAFFTTLFLHEQGRGEKINENEYFSFIKVLRVFFSFYFWQHLRQSYTIEQFDILPPSMEVEFGIP
jgi:hypothetical protein